MISGRQDVRGEILRILRDRAPEQPSPLGPAAFRAAAGPQPLVTSPHKQAVRSPPSKDGIAFSLMFFSASTETTPTGGLYDLVLNAARFADEHEFAAVWVPERHFHSFGGPYPDPSVLAAALATATRRVRLRAGSVIAPLDHPLRIAERWAVVDNLSGGRVDISFGSGWNPNDFVLSPDNFADSRGVFRTHVASIRRLWRGDAISFRNGQAEDVPTAIYPRPIQPELPVWVSATGTAETFRWAGASGFNILTMVLGGDLDQLAEKIGLYRAARAEAGHDPTAGIVTLMLHTFVHADAARAEAEVRDPFMDYVRSSVDLQRHGTAEGKALTEAQREQIVTFAYERYRQTAALFGTPEHCLDMIDRVVAIGVDEIACLIDFGLPDALVLEGLEHLDALRRRTVERAASIMSPRTAPSAKAAPPVAVVGIAARLPKSPDHWQFWDNLCAGRELVGPSPAGRFDDVERPSLKSGGFLEREDIEGFEPERFKIAPSEAALMDPHQRLFLEAVWEAQEDAGLRPGDLRGSDTAVFAAIYSTAHADRRAHARQGSVDPLGVTGGIRSMTPNRVSFAFDWTGASEVVDTACSSGLVAVHRAVRALRAGECGLAVAGGVSLLLSDAENAGLRDLGVLSATGHCRPFDAAADGQVRGEGVGVVVLKRLADAERDGDFIYGVIRGSAVNHNGGRAGSLTLPDSQRQADCIVAACRDADLPIESVSYIEAHGAGTPAGDVAEISAFGRAWRQLAPADPMKTVRCAIGSVKANIGSLDAASGIAGLIKVLLALRDGVLPRMPGLETPAAECMVAGTPFRFQTATAAWPQTRPRRAGVHGYGLGGVNAHLIVEAHCPPAAPVPSHAAPRLIVLSAPSAATLTENRRRLRAFLEAPASSKTSLADIAYTLLVAREHFAHHWHAVVESKEELRRTLAVEDKGPPVPTHLAPLLAAFEARQPLDRDFVSQFQPGRRVPLPPGAFAHRRFALDPSGPDVDPAGNDPVEHPPAGATGGLPAAYNGIHLTLVPFPEVVEGFSWTGTFQDPSGQRAHLDLIRTRQREMREVAFAGIDFGRIGRVVDFGCRLATDLIDLTTRYPHLLGVGYTTVPGHAEAARLQVHARHLGDRIQVHCLGDTREPFQGRFDLALGFEAAHHIADKPRLFANLAACLTNGGHLVLADCVANTVMPIELPTIGIYISPKDDYARMLANAGFVITECVNLSPEVTNFLHDPDPPAAAAAETTPRRDTEAAGLLVAEVQRSWKNLGGGLRAGMLQYLLITATRDGDVARAEAVNHRQLEGG